MPAVVSSTDGSCSAGTSDAGGQALVVAALEEGEEALADLVGGHRALSLGCAPMRVVTSTRVVYENRWMRLHEDHTERADGSPGLYAWIEKPPAALIVPLDGRSRVAGRAVPPPGRRALLGVPAGRRGRTRRSPQPRRSPAASCAEETGLRAARDGAPRPLYFAYGLSNQPSTSGARPDSNPASRRSRRPSTDSVAATRFADRPRSSADDRVDDERSATPPPWPRWHLATPRDRAARRRRRRRAAGRRPGPGRRRGTARPSSSSSAPRAPAADAGRARRGEW